MGQAAAIEQDTQLQSGCESRRTVVVVDDDDAMRQAIERLLTCSGFEAQVFASAGALLQSGTAGSAACLVLDVQLPDQTGFELQRTLTLAGARRPVIFITGFDSPNARAEAARVVAARLLHKPFRGQQLLDAIAAVIDGDWKRLHPFEE